MFILPPPNKRRWPAEFATKWFGDGFRKDRDDTYVYYLIFIAGFVAAILSSLPYVASFVLAVPINLLGIKIEVSQPDLISDIVPSYLILTTLVLIVEFLYGNLLFKRNDIAKLDLAEWNQKLLINSKGKRSFYRTSCIIHIIALYGATCLPLMIIKYYSIANSPIFFVFVLAFLALAVSSAAMYIFFLFQVLKQWKK